MMRKKKKDLGELELAVLNAVFERPASSVREIAEVMAEERGLARTTILTVMQRLHAKSTNLFYESLHETVWM